MAFDKAKWIWTEEATADVNAYALFSTVFPGGDGATLLRIAVAGNYAAWVNGVFAAFGQYSDTPEHKTYSETEISRFCREGPNDLLVEVHFSGNGFTSHTDGAPGLIAEVVRNGVALSSSGATWRAAIDHRFAQGERAKLFGSLNYNFAFDARVPVPSLANAKVLPDRARPTPRPIPPLPAGPFAAPRKIAVFEKDDAVETIFDFGEETTGLLDFEVKAQEGTRLEIAHAEYLVEGRLNPRVFEKKHEMVDRYLCKDGTNAFFHPLRRWGGRYFSLKAIGAKDAFEIVRFGLRPVIADLPAPPFTCSDEVFAKAHAISARTLRLCLHEKYENCPWREQSICAYDARNQMLFGYGFWGNYDRAEAMIDLFAQGAKPNGFIRAAAPTARDLWIPVFTFAWMLAIDDLALYSGSDRVFRRLATQLESMLAKILAAKKEGLWAPPDDPDRWDYGECRNIEYADDPPNAFYNLSLYEALARLAPRFRALGRTGIASQMEKTLRAMPALLETRFWDETAGAYADRVNPERGREGLYAIVQTLFLHNGLVPPERVPRLLALLKSGALADVALPSMPYLVRVFHRYGTEDDKQWLHDKIRALLKRQIDAGATTWWEDIDGPEYGGGMGSLCHGWSAFEAWYETEWLLGVKRLAPGYARYEIKPFIPKGMTAISGQVHTPFGPIFVSRGQKVL